MQLMRSMCFLSGILTPSSTLEVKVGHHYIGLWIVATLMSQSFLLAGMQILMPWIKMDKNTTVLRCCLRAGSNN
ncbi:uncharacterized protein DS421_12g379930 [Arachis hypogaea]|nr:uncharacterized protein DS421_12g379930 [Arachis hypogaea]